MELIIGSNNESTKKSKERGGGKREAISRVLRSSDAIRSFHKASRCLLLCDSSTCRQFCFLSTMQERDFNFGEKEGEGKGGKWLTDGGW